MKNLLITPAWDAEGEDPIACNLPDCVLVINVPDQFLDALGSQDTEYAEKISLALSETYGFNHSGWSVIVAEYDTPGNRKFWPANLAVIQAPT